MSPHVSWIRVPDHDMAATETDAHHDTLATHYHHPGDVVRVLTAYRMSDGSMPSRYVADGAEGVYVVIARMPSNEYKLARVPRNPTGNLYIPAGFHRYAHEDVYINASRIERVMFEVL